MGTVRCTTRPEPERSASERGAVEARFRAMGSDAHVLVTGPDGDVHVATARRRIDELERRWSRFIEDSEVSLLNRMAGTGDGIVVGPDTLAVLERAKLAVEATHGVWNPLLGARLSALGYDRSFDAGLLGPATELLPVDAPNFDDVDIDSTTSAVALPADAALDLGGIAKGFAADVVTGELLRNGAWGALVSLGGDLRVRGMSPTGLDWGVAVSETAIEQPHLTTIRLTQGGIATSTTARRQWPSTAERPHHHLLDPATGRSAASDIVLTTAIAGSAWWAEVCATATTIDPTLELPRHAALQVDRRGAVTRTPDFARYES